MKGDFSRSDVSSRRGYSGVLMQQGRVQLDADWNEQVAIDAWRLRRFIADALGRHGGPKDRLGYALEAIEGADGDFSIGAGRYYVDGWGCENQRADRRYTTQDDLPGLKPLASNESLWPVHYAVWGPTTRPPRATTCWCSSTCGSATCAPARTSACSTLPWAASTRPPARC